ncbi:MAG: AMP-binding protein [Gammaproteobacteria bacterium]|nr:AMP-binding protein [Gammaproteobacteria bacterium]
MDIKSRIEKGQITLPQLLSHWAHTQPKALALREKDLGIWKRYTWKDYYRTVCRTALGLKQLGFQENDKLSIASEDTPEWMYGDLAVQALGGVTVGIYPTNPWPELTYIVDHSESRFAICGDQEQVDKFIDARNNGEPLTRLEKVICVDMKGMRNYQQDWIISFDDLLALGDEYAKNHPGAEEAFAKELDGRDPSDVAVLVYTSGTTGPPKGAMLSHKNLIIGAHPIKQKFGFNQQNYEVVCYLPLCHAAERLFSTVMHCMTGGIVNYAESVDTVAYDVREIAPKAFLGVPRIWEKLQQGILIRMQDATPLQKRVFDFCMKQGRGILDRTVANQGQRTFTDSLRYFLLWILCFRSLHKYLGLNRSRANFCGGASISPEVVRFFYILGIPVFQAYGQTESSGLSFVQDLNHWEIGATGLPVPGLEYQLSEEGELLVKFDSVFVGYYKNEKATAETIVDGWLHTGDIVEFSDRGELLIVDRKKAIIITSGGKNISPSEIENALKDSLYIREAIVVGEGRNYLGALIQIDFDTVGKWAQERKIAYTTFKSLSKLPEVADLIGKEVERVNAQFARVENIRKFVLLEKELDHDDGELTATQKVRRSTIEKKFKKEIVE